MTDSDTSNLELEIPEELYASLVEEAAEVGASLEEYVLQLILEYCKEILSEQEEGA